MGLSFRISLNNVLYSFGTSFSFFMCSRILIVASAHSFLPLFCLKCFKVFNCSPASLLKSHPQSIGSVFLSLISLEEGLAQNSWSLPLTSLQITNR